MPETTVDASAQKLPVCRHIRVESARHVLLAMQKVEGSNAFSRFQKTCICRSFSCAHRLVRGLRAGPVGRSDWLGWSPGQSMEWRGAVTVRALATLGAHGRIKLPHGD
jgi:hypothetical protein